MPALFSKNTVPYSPLVSILIPCYNAEPWIRQCIQSALDQTYANKEIIVFDDGSTDGSLKVLEDFGDRIKFRACGHAGGNAIRNQLTQAARGEWLQYLDADDYLLPGKIASQLAAGGESQPAVDVIYSPVIIRDMSHPGADYIQPIEDSDETVTFVRWGALNTGGLLLRRQAVIEVGGWKEDQPCCQEHELLLRLRLAGRRFLFHDHAAAVYRRHGSETVSKKDPLLAIKLRMELTDRLVEYLESSGELKAAHRTAVFAGRMECARSAYKFDRQLAEQLSAKANAQGRRWVSGSHALPIRYQIALRLAGFANVERFAARIREMRPRSRQFQC